MGKQIQIKCLKIFDVTPKMAFRYFKSTCSTVPARFHKTRHFGDGSRFGISGVSLQRTKHHSSLLTAVCMGMHLKCRPTDCHIRPYDAPTFSASQTTATQRSPCTSEASPKIRSSRLWQLSDHFWYTAFSLRHLAGFANRPFGVPLFTVTLATAAGWRYKAGFP